jgi:colanic acid biosynthesis glycosyl transferase WcaI
VFNVQDIFPDAAVRTGAISDRRVIAVARRLERFVYARSRAVVVVGDDMGANVAAKIAPTRRDKVRVIPNFVDTERVVPSSRRTEYRRELGIGDEPVVMYAGNVGFSQSLDTVVEAARRIPSATFVINGDGSAKAEVARDAADVANVRLGDYQSADRVPEVLATADIHLVPLRAGLGSVSVPSKTYGILAAGRPVVAAIDEDTDVPRILAASGAGIAVTPDDPDALVAAIERLLADPAERTRMGEQGRRWAEENVSLVAVGDAYWELLGSLGRPGSARRASTGP